MPNAVETRDVDLRSEMPGRERGDPPVGRPLAPTDPLAVCEVSGADADRVARTRARLVPETITFALADTFRLLGDPTRVRLIDALSHGELCVCDLAAVVGLSESAVSHQLRLLRSVRLVRPRKRGRMVFYALDDHHILDLIAQGRRHVEEHTPGGAPPAD